MDGYAVLEDLGSWIESSGDLVYLAAPLFTVVVAILPIPAEIPAMVNGMAFDPWWGSLVTWFFALVGAQISFEIARRGGRPLCARFVPPRWLERADAAALIAGWPALLLLRLVPTVAFTAVNWAAGLTTLRRRTFVWTTAVGIAPGAIAFSATGSGLHEFLRDSGSAGGALWLGLGLVGLLLLAAIVRHRRASAARPTA